MTRPSTRALVVVLAVAVALPSNSMPSPAQEVPYLSGYVTDQAGIIDDATRVGLESSLAAFEAETGSQVVVLTLESLGGASVEDVALRVAETAGIGRAGVDDGVLLLVAQQERALRIEVGYGFEGALTDAESRRILDRIVVPRFREGRFGVGVAEGVGAILSELRGEVAAPAAAPSQARRTARRDGMPVVAVLFLLLLLVFVLVLWRARQSHPGWGRTWSSRSGPAVWSGERNLSRHGSGSRRSARLGRRRGSGRRRGGGFGGGGFSGGGFSGGGGSFGGGGASSGW